MDKEKYDMVRLIALHLAGEIAEEERERLRAWVDASAENAAFFERVCRERGVSGRWARWQGIDWKAGYARFARRVRGRRMGWSRWAGYAAAVAVVAGVAGWLWLGGGGGRTEPSVVAERIVPGERRATLLLSSGESVALGGRRDSLTREEGETRVTTTGEGVVYERRAGEETAGADGPARFNTLRTERGGEYAVELEDGTVVRLNAASELRYPVRFDGEERVVWFEGEGYFEVAEDAKRPFSVVTDGVRVVVHGTEFNVNTFDGAGVRTVLVEGSVGVRVEGRSGETRLRPSQMAEVDAGSGRVTVTDVDVREYVAWKDGFFVFDDEPLEEIMGELARWYDAEVFFVNEGARGLRFTGHLRRYDEIDVILRAIEGAVDVRFSVNGKAISVTRQ